MKRDGLEEEIDLSELGSPTSVSAGPPAAATVAPSPDAKGPELGEHFLELIEQIPAPLRKGTLHIFIELHHLLRYLDLIEECIRKKAPHKSVTLFERISHRGNALIDKVNHFASEIGKEDQILRDTLEGISFALRHELHRTFDGKALTLKIAGQEARFSRAEMLRAWGILQNCFQQSTVTLAQVFDPRLNACALFANYKDRQEQSLILRRELVSLLHKIRRLEAGGGMLQNLHFVNSLKQFQTETMHFLLYRDWEIFEAFVKEIAETYDEMGDLAPAFHRFSSYLETLLRHVNMRTVLSDEPLYSDETATALT